MPILINENLKIKKTFLEIFDKKGIENRPILSGNFLNQPSIELYGLRQKKIILLMHKKLNLGFFIGLHTSKLSNKLADYIVKNLLSIDKI